MKKTYKYRLPQNKEVKSFNTKIENGNLLVEVELGEKFEPKDEDFLVSSQGKVFIYCDKRTLYNDSYCCYCAEYFSGSGIIIESSRYSGYWIRKAGCRYATEQEKAKFLERLEKEYHKRWNAETKQLEDIRWRPKEGRNKWYVDRDGEVVEVIF